MISDVSLKTTTKYRVKVDQYNAAKSFILTRMSASQATQSKDTLQGKLKGRLVTQMTAFLWRK